MTFNFYTMGVEIVTKEDLVEFRTKLIQEIEKLITKVEPKEEQWLRSIHVRELLNISPGTLQNLRISGKLKYSKVGGIHFYRQSDVERMIVEGE
jgi:hypothetical protein